ncbi:MAG: NAD-dependent epimerase/dehydratase family protein [Usitatibacter sp.]
MTSSAPPQKIFITGSSGFVGRSLAAQLGARFEALHFGADDWADQVARADFRDATVFHLAARVHDDASASDAFMRDNVEKTRALAQAARIGGARRFVFLSTIKVNGEETSARAFTSTDSPYPQDAYGRSKWEAEQAIVAIDGLEAVIVRSPLVFGPSAKGNLRSLLLLADTPWPLPLGSIHNRRSFVHVDDLARLLVECATHPHAVGQTFLAAHRDPFSTPSLVAELRRCLARPERLFALPARALEWAATLSGAGEKMRRMTRSLEVDCEATRRVLGWEAQIALRPAIEDMVRAYREAGT